MGHDAWVRCEVALAREAKSREVKPQGVSSPPSEGAPGAFDRVGYQREYMRRRREKARERKRAEVLGDVPPVDVSESGAK